MCRAVALLVALTSLWACAANVMSCSSGSRGHASSSSSSGGTIRVPVNHRPNDAQCFTTPSTGSCNSGNGGSFMCLTDTQCADAGPNARCTSPFYGGRGGCICTHDACFHDSDCMNGTTCACHGSPWMGGLGNQCVPGNCRVDADCGPGGYCSPTYGSRNCGELAGYYCHTPADQCVDDSDCGDAGGYVCAYSMTSDRWECQQLLLCH